MVIVSIVGVLTAVGLPELTKAQTEAKKSAAEQEVVNAAKSCSIALITETAAPSNPTGITGACAKSTNDTPASLRATGGGKTYTVTIDENGIPSKPSET